MQIATVVANDGAAILNRNGEETKKLIPFGECGEIIRDEFVKGVRLVRVQFGKMNALLHPDDIFEDDEFLEGELAFAA